MERIGTRLYFWTVLWLISEYLIVCESSNNNTTEITKSPKFSNVTVTLCNCNSGEVMNLLGQCQPYEKGTVVPTLSHPESEPQLIDTKEFDIWVHKTSCVHPQVHLREGEFIIWVEGDTELQVIEGPYRGLILTDYCIHHQWKQGKVKVTAQGCVSVPIVPRCCHMDSGDCSDETSSTLEFNPPLATGMPPGDQGLIGAHFQWEFLQEHIEKPICESGDILKKIELNGRKAHLIARPDMVLLTWHPAGMERQFGYPPDYCVDYMKAENKYYAYICQMDLDVYCANEECTYKCCYDGDAFSMETMTCIPKDLPFTSIHFTSPPNTTATFVTYPTCTNGHLEESYLTDITDFKLTSNGSLIHDDITYPSIKYCTTTFIKGNSTELGALLCIKEAEKSYFEIVRSKIYTPCHGLSCGFLALLLLLHAWIPKLRENEGMYQLFHAASLLIAFSLQVIFMYLTPQGYRFSGACVPLALVMQFSYLSAFFWLNAMCFDVWRLFRKLVRNPYSPIPCVHLWKMVMYAFGGPFTITVITMIVQFAAPRDGSISALVHPIIGENRCWFKGMRETVPYFYAPITSLFVLNLIFIGNTYHYLKIIQKDQTSDQETSGDINNRKTDCITVFWQQLYILLILAVLWLTDILSLIIPPKEIWIPTDILNTLQGVFIFFVFLMNDKKRRSLKEQLPKLLEFTNSWIDETDAAQADNSNNNPGLSKTKSPLHFMARFTTTTSFNLNTNEENDNNTRKCIRSLSIVKKLSQPMDKKIDPCAPISK